MSKARPYLFTLTNSSIPAFAVLLILTLLSYGCVSSNTPKTISILPAAPLSQTGVSSYPSLETVFNSDNEIVLLAVWDNAKTSGNHTLKWEMVNGSGDIIFFRERTNFTIREDLFITQTVTLENEVKKKLTQGELTVNFYLDNVLTASKKTQYSPEKIVNKSGRKIVIHPFNETDSHPEEWNDGAKSYFQNTFASALYGEVKRIFPDTVPHYLSEQKIGNTVKTECFGDKECTNFLQDQFGDSIFIYGESAMQHFEIGVSVLRFYVFDPRTGGTKMFSDTSPFLGSYSLMMHDLLENVLYKKEFLDYLKNYNDM